MTKENSQWVPILSWEGLYEINRSGQIKSLRKNIVMKESKDNNGYPCIRLIKNKKYKNLRIHKLVTNTFIGKCKKGNCVNHIDGNKENSTLPNLEYVSYSENAKHAYRIGLRNSKGEKQHRSTLKNNQVKIIKDLARKGLGARKIATIMGISFNAIYGITNRGNWSHIE